MYDVTTLNPMRPFVKWSSDENARAQLHGEKQRIHTNAFEDVREPRPYVQIRIAARHRLARIARLSDRLGNRCALRERVDMHHWRASRLSRLRAPVGVASTYEVVSTRAVNRRWIAARTFGGEA
jgi:hypothetical protein